MQANNNNIDDSDNTGPVAEWESWEG